ncbi:MAG: hypothetical protein NNA18_01580 [Nitrospira sp.]|nr:hypothetical protein [Nitrospira sp.]
MQEVVFDAKARVLTIVAKFVTGAWFWSPEVTGKSCIYDPLTSRTVI